MSHDNVLGYLAAQAQTGDKYWFGYPQQRVINIALCHRIAARHADKLSPAQIVDYVLQLNDQMYRRIVTNAHANQRDA
jgi:hypothetical protein